MHYARLDMEVMMNNSIKQLKTVKDWLLIPESERAELINGEIYMHPREGEIMLQAAASPKHSDVQAEIILSLAPYKRGAKKTDGSGGSFEEWRILPEVGIEYNCHNLFIHDIAGWKKSRLTENPSKSPITMTPDWVCEILSSNWKIDTHVKFNVLQKEQVPYYWTIDIQDEVIVVYEYIDGNYIVKMNVSTENKEVILPPFNEITFDIEEFFKRVA